MYFLHLLAKLINISDTTGDISNNQTVLKIGSIKIICGTYSNQGANKAKITFIEPFKKIFNVQVTSYGNDFSTMRIEHGRIFNDCFEVAWQQFSDNEPILWVAFGIN